MEGEITDCKLIWNELKRRLYGWLAGTWRAPAGQTVRDWSKTHLSQLSKIAQTRPHFNFILITMTPCSDLSIFPKIKTLCIQIKAEIKYNG